MQQPYLSISFSILFSTFVYFSVKWTLWRKLCYMFLSVVSHSLWNCVEHLLFFSCVEWVSRICLFANKRKIIRTNDDQRKVVWIRFDFNQDQKWLDSTWILTWRFSLMTWLDWTWKFSKGWTTWLDLTWDFFKMTATWLD